MEARLTEWMPGLDGRGRGAGVGGAVLVLGHDAELVVLVDREVADAEEGRSHVAADLDPVAAALALLHHIVGDLSSAVVLGRVPEEGEGVAVELVGAEVLGRRWPVQDAHVHVHGVESGRVLEAQLVRPAVRALRVGDDHGAVVVGELLVDARVALDAHLLVVVVPDGRRLREAGVRHVDGEVLAGAHRDVADAAEVDARLVGLLLDLDGRGRARRGRVTHVVDGDHAEHVLLQLRQVEHSVIGVGVRQVVVLSPFLLVLLLVLEQVAPDLGAAVLAGRTPRQGHAVAADAVRLGRVGRPGQVWGRATRR